MSKLREIYELYENLPSCIFVDNPQYITDIDTGALQKVDELLIFQKNELPFEQLLLGYVGSELLVSFEGDADNLRRTLEKLDLPSGWPANLAEKVCWRFRDVLEDESLSGVLTMQQRTVLGKEDHFIKILDKIAAEYNKSH